MCWLAGVSRAGYYRNLLEQDPEEEDNEVRAAIQEIAMGHHRRYGYRRIGAELRRRGLQVNHKRVARMMREDNLLAIRSRRFVITTDSRHDLEVYLNLAKRMTLTAVNQHSGRAPGSDGAGARHRGASARTGSGTSLRQRRSICVGGVYEPAG